MALVKNRTMFGYAFGYHVLMEANYNRLTSTVKAVYYLYKDKASFNTAKNAPIKKLTVTIPFSAYNAQNLLNVVEMTEDATIRSVLNEAEEQQNWYYDAVKDDETA